MEKSLIKMAIYTVAFITIIVCILSNIFPSIVLIRCLTSIASISEILLIVYCKWLWRFKWLNFLRVKNLNGKWECKISYKFNKISNEKNAIVNIKQDLFNMQINMDTNEVSSYSISCSIIYEHNMHYLIYTYRTEAKKEYRDKNRDQWGAVKLKIEGQKMLGEYWTNNKTDGIMELMKIS